MMKDKDDDSREKQDTAVPVWVDLYESSEGPVLRMDIQERDHLLQLLEASEDLRSSKITDMSLEDLFPTICTGVRGLALRRVEGSGMMRKSIFRIPLEQGRSRFLWSTTSDGWYQNPGLLEGLVNESGQGGHQYFGEDSGDDACLEICFGEERDEALLRRSIAEDET